MMSELEHWVEFEPAHDCIVNQPCKFGSAACQPGKGGSHGRGSVSMKMVVKGPLGVVQFVVYTGWDTPQTPPNVSHHAMAADLGYHSPVPMWEGQEEYPREDCQYLGGRCYYDGSGLNAEEPWRLLREEGGMAVWDFLDSYYASTFEAKGETVG